MGQMLAMVRQNPALLQPLLEEMSRSNPELLRLINENQGEFQQLLNSSTLPATSPGGLAGEAPPGQVQIRLTQEEADAVGRLEQLGFPREAVLQAYIACEKNETMAANLLFDGVGDD